MSSSDPRVRREAKDEKTTSLDEQPLERGSEGASERGSGFIKENAVQDVSSNGPRVRGEGEEEELSPTTEDLSSESTTGLETSDDRGFENGENPPYPWKRGEAPSETIAGQREEGGGKREKGEENPSSLLSSPSSPTESQATLLDLDQDLRELLQRARNLDKVASKTSCAEIMLRKGLISQDQLKEVIENQGETKVYFHQIIADMKLVPKNKILEAAAEGWDVKYIDLEEGDIDPEIIKMIPKSKAHRNLSIPVYKNETKLSVAMANPLDIFAADDIKISLHSTGLDFVIEPLLAFPNDIQKKLDEAYGVTDAIVQEMLEGIQDDEISLESLSEESDDELDIARSEAAARERPVIALVNAILLEAVRQGATDIHIEPFEKKSLLRYRIDSRLREVPKIPSLPRSRHDAVVSRLKIMASCDIAERRLPQDGRIKLKAAGKEYDLRVSIVPTSDFGEGVVMRVTDKSSTDLSLEQLGFAAKNLDMFQNAIEQPYGLILVTGPTGSGKTTTLYSALNTINTPEIKILTAENPVERNLDGAVQVQTKFEIDLDFAKILKYFLRHDPDVIMVGEIRDEETAKMSIEAALTGHLVFSTLHTNNAASSIIRLYEMGINEFLLASSVQLAMAQRLVRRVCEKCKRPVAPTGKMLRELEICNVDTANLELYRGMGCNACGGIGLRGMTAIHELLYVDEDIRQLILKGDFSAPQIQKLAREKGMRSLREDGMEKVAKGITTYEEVILKTMDV
jgi:type IV pilus assembly protein PilB